jgi:hypothetical protein
VNEGSGAAERASLPGGDFRLFVTRLSFQTMMALGQIENPLTRTRQRNLGNARMLVDDLVMLREKCAGNLTPDELTHLEKVISDNEYALERLEETELERARESAAASASDDDDELL